jgi:hypothetical protein
MIKVLTQTKHCYGGFLGSLNSHRKFSLMHSSVKAEKATHESRHVEVTL